jgi:3-phenylpropionate/trans-cinnamate dioxygenase ferredoxin reductase subunit
MELYKEGLMVKPSTARLLKGILWIGIYLAFVTAPLLMLLLGPAPPGRGFWMEFAVALSFSGLTMMLLQFALTARFRRAKAPFGIDIVYFFHRQISYVILALLLLHPIILFTATPVNLDALSDDFSVPLLGVVTVPWRAAPAVGSLIALTVLFITSIWRERLGIEYSRWRRWHGILAVTAVVLGMVHLVGAGHHVFTPWKRVLWIGYGACWIGLLFHVRVVKPWLQLRTPYRVVRVKSERDNAWTLTFRADGHKGITFSPGQFAWLNVWDSPFSNQEHPFSFSSSAESPEELEMTIKELGDFTATIGNVAPGQIVYLDGPYGAFSVDRYRRAPGYVFIAGGIGITPVMSMLRSLADRGDPRPLLLIYANKNWRDVTFREEIQDLERRLNLRIVHVLEDPPESWSGEKGMVDKDLLKRHLPELADLQEYFVCGPPPLMDAVEKSLYQLGTPPGNVHAERFNLV